MEKKPLGLTPFARAPHRHRPSRMFPERSGRRSTHLSIGFALAAALVLVSQTGTREACLAQQPKPVPPLQVIPQPYGQAAFVFLPNRLELCRFHAGFGMFRPFLYPVRSPSGWELTRMGHPHDPVSHSHHNSVWISHADVNGFDFWGDRPQTRIVCLRISEYGESVGSGDEGDVTAWLVADLEWQAEGKPLLKERRRVAVRIPGSGEMLWRSPEEIVKSGYFVLIKSQLTAVNQAVTVGRNPFGLIGVRMAKSIGVRDGGGRILNSDGLINEKEVFRKVARWVDYSGPLTHQAAGGITLFDHPKNPGFPHAFHVRDDGWMGICLTLENPVTIEPEQVFTFRSGLWCHDGVPDQPTIEQRWELFKRWSETAP